MWARTDFCEESWLSVLSKLGRGSNSRCAETHTSHTDTSHKKLCQRNRILAVECHEWMSRRYHCGQGTNMTNLLQYFITITFTYHIGSCTLFNSDLVYTNASWIDLPPVPNWWCEHLLLDCDANELHVHFFHRMLQSMHFLRPYVATRRWIIWLKLLVLFYIILLRSAKCFLI